MSAPRFTSRLSSLGGAAVFALLAVTATAALGGTVSIGTFEGLKGGFYNVSESGSTAPNFTPPSPEFSDNSALQLKFTPSNYMTVETGTTDPISLKYKTAQILVPIKAKQLVDDPFSLGYQLTAASLHIAGSYSLQVPFNSSQAQFAVAAQYTAQVTEVDWKSWTTGSPIQATMSITPSGKLDLGPSVNFDDGSWFGDVALDWDLLRSEAGLTPGQYVTGVTVNLSTDIGAASLNAYAKSTLLNYNINAPIAPVAVPEPPTVILAGLGVAAAVGHGYRRRLRRSALPA